MIKPHDYDTAQSFDTDYKRLPAGGYVCVIKKIEEKLTRTGTTMIVVSYDIAEGEYAGYYARLYKSAKSSSRGDAPKWRGTYNVFPYDRDGSTNGHYKALVESIEKSNGVEAKWADDYNQFTNKIVGLLMHEEEYESSDTHEVRTTTRACASRSVDVIRSGAYEIPRKKLLAAENDSHPYAQSVVSTGYEAVDYSEDDLPF
ncbi:MAG: DUF669 domain-containing protein [Clostridia bacterium]|nr:DUF669 domain-containing protein [Clostridia bacterium]